jgi:hypothetical protein
MTQEERWNVRYQEVMDFMEKNHRNPSKFIPEERGQYLNWIKHNRKLYSAGLLKEERVGRFKELLALMEEYKRVNQYV